MCLEPAKGAGVPVNQFWKHNHALTAISREPPGHKRQAFTI